MSDRLSQIAATGAAQNAFQRAVRTGEVPERAYHRLGVFSDGVPTDSVPYVFLPVDTNVPEEDYSVPSVSSAVLKSSTGADPIVTETRVLESAISEAAGPAWVSEAARAAGRAWAQGLSNRLLIVAVSAGRSNNELTWDPTTLSAETVLEQASRLISYSQFRIPGSRTVLACARPFWDLLPGPVTSKEGQPAFKMVLGALCFASWSLGDASEDTTLDWTSRTDVESRYAESLGDVWACAWNAEDLIADFTEVPTLVVKTQESDDPEPVNIWSVAGRGTVDPWDIVEDSFVALVKA